MRHRSTWFTFLGALLLLTFSADASAKKPKKQKDADAGAAVVVESWLVLGPVSYPLPVFHDSEQGGFDAESLLGSDILPTPYVRPVEAETVSWFTGGTTAWTSGQSGKGGEIELPFDGPDEASPAVAWSAAYLTVDRWQSLKLDLLGTHPRRAWLDGRPVASGGTGDEPAEVEATLELERGQHVLLVQTVFDPSREEDWQVGARLTASEGEDTPGVTASTDPTRDVSIFDVLDAPQITSHALSPDGTRVVLTVKRILPGTDDAESWIEIRETTRGDVIDSWRGAVGAGSVSWSPHGRYIAYKTKAAGGDDKSSSILLYDLATSRVSPLVESMENLGGYVWSPTGNVIAYSTTEKAEADERGVKLLEGLMDRWATYRDKEFLHLVTVPDGLRRRLTAGGLTTSVSDFSPDGKKLLFSRRVETFEARPYSRSELWEVELETLTSRNLRDFGWLVGAHYAPDGRRILVSSQPSEFGALGLDLPREAIDNSYDTQLFIWDPDSGDVDPITRSFDPAVDSAVWSRRDGKIYVRATDGDRRRVFRYDPDTGRFESILFGVEVIAALEVAREADVALAYGSSAWTPQTLARIDLETMESARLAHPGDEWFSDLRGGTVRPWQHTLENGRPIDGRIYLPPNFDSQRKYPCIVYYYGGTSPVTRSFGGRYPKEWWAAQGYVVYVLNPSGATGYGQGWSALHVNDWGQSTSEEILAATRAFLAAHPFVDRERVGCIGASFGGFMTMLLSTKTDLFAAAVSHAGISSISSYWGEGYWGYLYGSVANAESFPWNRRDVFVDQSPLFRADQARVPILLTHGTADKNVPVGESDAFYIALKLLGKDVEYLQVAGEDHWIVTHDKRLVWSRSIVAWFDRWLKDQPEWWNALYPAEQEK